MEAVNKGLLSNNREQRRSKDLKSEKKTDHNSECFLFIGLNTFWPEKYIIFQVIFINIVQVLSYFRCYKVSKEEGIHNNFHFNDVRGQRVKVQEKKWVMRKQNQKDNDDAKKCKASMVVQHYNV